MLGLGYGLRYDQEWKYDIGFVLGLGQSEDHGLKSCEARFYDKVYNVNGRWSLWHKGLCYKMYVTSHEV